VSIAAPIPTPTQAEPTAESQPQTAEIVPPAPQEPVLNSEQRRKVQQQLRVLGHYAAAIDGDFGPGTRRAILAFQRSSKLEATGYLTETTLVLLEAKATARAQELAAEQVAAEQLAAEQRAAEQRVAEQLAAQQRAAQELAAQQQAAVEAAQAEAEPIPQQPVAVPVASTSDDFAAVVATLEPIDETYVAVKPAKVRAAPKVTADLVAALEVGERIDVLGRLPGADWYVVARAGAPIGYVVRSQLAPEATAAATPATVSQPAVAAQPAIPAELAAVDFGRYYAVVIGNNSYRSLPRLNTAVGDAKAVAAVLEQAYGFQVSLLTDATEEAIVGEFARLRRTLTPEDNLLVYYAGHGWYDEEAERGYWLPTDAVEDNQSNWISNADITDMLKTLRAKHVLVVADSCYSGTLTRGLSIATKGPAYYQAVIDRRARTALTSGGLEPVLDAGGGGHSVFAKAFLDALEGNPGILDGESLFQQVREQVLLNAEQTPEYGNIRLAGHDGGDFLFVRQQ
jgi:peptidoglycan hydrolase-like protein with peptidoglycan-binding domain